MKHVQRRSRALALLAGGTALASMGLVGSAHAQSTTDLTEIVVTAKNRTERLQDVPLAITAVTNDTLRQADIRDSRDLQQLTPSLNMSIGGGRNDPTALSLRGVAPNTSDERYQAISFFIDGVALSGQLASLDLSQVERVEVIKGPQSASFGRATYTGAINYITKEPSGDGVNGSITLRGGANKDAPEGNYFASGYMAFPIFRDHLWGSVEGTVQQQGAVVKAINNGRPIGQERTQFVAGSLIWKPTESLTFKIRSSYNHDKDSVTLNYTLHPREFGSDLIVLPRGGGALFPRIVPDANFNLLADTSQNIDSIYPEGGFERDRYFTYGLAQYEFGGGFELSYRGSFFFNRDLRAAGTLSRSPTNDPIYAPLVAAGLVTLGTPFNNASRVASTERFVNFSHQLLLLSPGDKRLRYKAGLYYFSETDLNNFNIFKTVANPQGQTAGLATLTNAAVFGSLDFDFTDRLTLSAEGRYQEEEVGQERCIICNTVTPTGVSFKSTDFLPRVTLSYKLADGHMIYGLYSYGVKGGRISSLVVVGVPTVIYATPEKLDNYEIGSKNVFFDGRLVLNVAAYKESVRDQQLTSTQNVPTAAGGVVGLSYTGNVGQSEIWGYEIESTWRATDRVTFSGGVGYADQQFTGKNPIILGATNAIFFPGAVGSPVVLDGKQQANVPQYNGFVAAEYVQPDVWRGFSLGARLSGSYHGSYFFDVANTVQVPGAWTVNGRLRMFRDDLEISVFGRNLTNDNTPTSAGFVGATATCGFVERDTARFGTNQQCLNVGSQRPTEYGIEVTKRFGGGEAPPPPPPPAPPAPPPPPPPPPPPVAYEAREFVVYFPFDQYVLTPEAQQVIAQAADYAKTGNATRVVVVGHADTSGSAAYNVRLSERRAKATADALVGSGLAQTALAVDWKGESMPAVATGDGVKEPLNRRATININF